MQADEPTFEAVVSDLDFDPREGGVSSHEHFMADREHETWLEMVSEILNEPLEGGESDEPVEQESGA